MPTFSYPSLLNPLDRVSEQQLRTDRSLIAFDKTIAHLSRRGFLSTLAGAAALAAVNGNRAEAQVATYSGIIDNLNFALNFEYLEANFYLAVSGGAPLSASDMGSGGVAVMGAPAKLTLDVTTQAVAQALAADEINHIELLRKTITALGGTPISQPLINLAAKGMITTQAQFLTAARQFSALGSSAYAGAAPFLVTTPSALTAAAQILGAEGQHAGALNYLCINQGVVSPAIDAQDVPPTATNYFTVAPVNAFSPARTQPQVLGVAFGVSVATTTTPTAGVTIGGFFPSGVNGNIKST